MARIALLFHSYQVGGIARSNIRLAREFLRRGHEVDLLVGSREGELAREKPEEAREIVLRRSPRWKAVLGAGLRTGAGARDRLAAALAPASGSGKTLYGDSIATYLLDRRPDVLFARTAPLIVSAVLAREKSDASCRLIGSEHNRLQLNPGHTPPQWRYNLPPTTLRYFYKRCDRLLAVSEGIRKEIVEFSETPEDEVTTLHNPVLDANLEQLAAEPPPHPWLSQGIPVMLSVGKLNPQKDHQTLLRAFAEVRRRRPVRLIIVGGTRADQEAQAYANELFRLSGSLSIADDVAFVGHQSNPFAYMKHASLFVLSSAWEGLGNVLVEALACGCPVVSTDCESGPREILQDEKYGPLVPVGDSAALADAMEAVLERPLRAEDLKVRAAAFSVETVADRYEELAFS